jgi:hypothetical protein
MLVDIVVRNHEVVAAKPIKEAVPPIILVRTASGSVLPAVKWTGLENLSGSCLEGRLQDRIYGRLKGAALKEAFKIVRDNGGLDIQGEYGSLEISDKDFVS